MLRRNFIQSSLLPAVLPSLALVKQPTEDNPENLRIVKFDGKQPTTEGFEEELNKIRQEQLVKFDEFSYHRKDGVSEIEVDAWVREEDCFEEYAKKHLCWGKIKVKLGVYWTRGWYVGHSNLRYILMERINLYPTDETKISPMNWDSKSNVTADENILEILAAKKGNSVDLNSKASVALINVRFGR